MKLHKTWIYCPAMRICYEERNLKLHNLYCGKILIKNTYLSNSRPFFKGLVSFKGPVLFNQKIFNKMLLIMEEKNMFIFQKFSFYFNTLLDPSIEKCVGHGKWGTLSFFSILMDDFSILTRKHSFVAERCKTNQ